MCILSFVLLSHCEKISSTSFSLSVLCVDDVHWWVFWDFVGALKCYFVPSHFENSIQYPQGLEIGPVPSRFWISTHALLFFPLFWLLGRFCFSSFLSVLFCYIFCFTLCLFSFSSSSSAFSSCFFFFVCVCVFFNGMPSVLLLLPLLLLLLLLLLILLLLSSSSCVFLIPLFLFFFSFPSSSFRFGRIPLAACPVSAYGGCRFRRWSSSPCSPIVRNWLVWPFRPLRPFQSLSVLGSLFRLPLRRFGRPLVQPLFIRSPSDFISAPFRALFYGSGCCPAIPAALCILPDRCSFIRPPAVTAVLLVVVVRRCPAVGCPTTAVASATVRPCLFGCLGRRFNVIGVPAMRPIRPPGCHSFLWLFLTVGLTVVRFF